MKDKKETKKEFRKEDKMPDSLRGIAGRHSMHIGAAIEPLLLRTDKKYQELFLKEFSAATPENVMKMQLIHPERDRFDFSEADFLVDFCEKNNILLRGHTLVWHNQLPKWMQDGSFSRDELISIMREHIHAVVGRYKGKIVEWDVVNEAIDDEGNFRDSLWYSTIGQEFISLAFKFAHEADPDAALFYNDYNIESINNKSDKVYTMLTQLKSKGCPIHGLGLQAHFSLENFPPVSGIARNIERFSDLGLHIDVTEMDVRIKLPVTGKKLEEQAEIYGSMLKLAIDHKINIFILWGICDKHSWIPGFFKDHDSGLLFDKDYLPKPAYHRMIRYLKRS